MLNNRSEETEGVVFASWCRQNNLHFTHIPNQNDWSFMSRQMALRLASKNKRMGVSTGIPDYMILTPKGILWVELKRVSLKGEEDPLQGWKEGQKSKGGLKRSQKEWIDAINKTPGTQAAVCYGAEEAIAFVEPFLKR